MRPGGFEPPTNGLEGRRSSAELRARDRRVAVAGPGYRTPKSAVMIVTAPPPYSPVELLECTAAMPISRQDLERMFSRWPALPIQSSTAFRARRSGEHQIRFSPPSQLLAPWG